MDLIKQNKVIGWAIAILVALNILTLTIIWIQAERKPAPPVRETGNGQTGSVELLQREIGLSADQTKAFQAMRRDYQERTKSINDELDAAKLRLADLVFESNPEKRQVDSMSSKIGELQSKIEDLRFDHFRQLAQICTQEQKEKLHPILREVFGKKSPNENPAVRPENGRPADNPRLGERRQESPADTRRLEDRQQNEQSPPGDRPGPPSTEEKLERYVQRLSLTPEQAKKIGEILKSTRAKEEAFKSAKKPTELEFEREKERIRTEEDNKVMQILNQDQKKKFEQIVRNRGKQVRN